MVDRGDVGTRQVLQQVTRQRSDDQVVIVAGLLHRLVVLQQPAQLARPVVR